MTKQEFINRVMLIMNEAGLYDAQGNSFIGADAAQIDKHIEGSYVDAWRRVAKVAPRTWLGNKSFKTTVGIIDTFIVGDGSDTDNKGGGFHVNDICYFKSSDTTSMASIKVLTVGVEGQISTAEIVSGGSGFTTGRFYTIYSTTGTGGEGGDGSPMGIKVTAVKSITTTPVPSLSEGIGYVALPEDFYLLTKFKMIGWRVPAMEASLTNTRVANLQSNEYTRGSQLRPAVVIDNAEVDGLIKPILRYYSLPKGLTEHVVEEALYVPVAKELTSMELTDDLGINDQIIVPLAYLSAATVFTILEKPQVAAGLEARAEAMLPGLVSLKGTNATVKQ